MQDVKSFALKSDPSGKKHSCVWWQESERGIVKFLEPNSREVWNGARSPPTDENRHLNKVPFHVEEQKRPD